MIKHFLSALACVWVCLGISFAQVTMGNGVTIGTGPGGVSSVSDLSPLFGVTNPTSTPVFNLIPWSAHYWLGNCSGGSANPTDCLIGSSDVSPNWYAVDTGAVNALVATLPDVTAYTPGLMVEVLPAFANTTSQPPVAPTLNVNTLGAAPIIKAGGNALSAGDLLTTEIAFLIMDISGNWELQNPQTGSGGGGGSSSTTYSNIDDLGTGSVPGPQWTLYTAPNQTCGTTPPCTAPSAWTFSINNTNHQLDGDSMLLSETTALTGNQTNILAVFKSKDSAATAAAIQQMSFDVEVYITNASAASAFEFDQWIFSDVHHLNTEFMFGSQCHAGFWEVFNQATKTWHATSGTCSFVSNTWYRVQESVHRVAGDTSNCAGQPCEYYDSIMVNGVLAPGFVPVSYPAGTLPAGWSSDTGWQFQIDSAQAGVTIGEYLDIASMTESAGAAAGSITGVTAGPGITGGGTSGNVSVSLATALPNGTTATTQTVGDNTNKAATDAFVIANASGGVAVGATINPGYLGSGNNNFCYTDPTVNTTAAVCAAAFKATTPAMSSGLIIDNRPYDVTTNFFLGSKKWSGTWELGTGLGGTTPSTANPTVWILEVPLILPTGAEIKGLTGPGIGYGNDVSGSSILMTGTNFPGPIPPPSNGAFTVTPSGSGGNLPAGTYYLELVYTNNLMGSTSGNPVAGYSYHTVEQSVVVGGSGSGSIVISGVPTANCGGCGGGSPFNATGYSAAISTVSGQEIAACNQTTPTTGSGCTGQAATCGTVDTSDPVGACLLGTSETITNVPSLGTTGAFAPPVVDLTSVAIVLGDTNSTSFGQSNSFAQTLQGIILVAGPVYKQASCGSAGNNCVPAATTPSVAVWSRTEQEGAIADQLDAWGPWQGAIFYIGHGNTGGIRAFQPNGNQYIDASASSTTGSPFYDLIVDGCMYNVVSEVNLFSSSFNYHPHGTVTQASSNVYARGCGNATYVNAYGLHTEEWNSNAGSDNYTADWGATVNLFGGAGFANGGAVLHRTSTGTAINNVGMAQQGFFGSPCIQDDARTLTIKPGSSRANFPCNYDSVNYVAKNALVSNQSAISSTAFVNIGASGASNSAFTFGVVPSGRYKLECEIYATSSTATAGPQIQVTGPGSPTSVQNSLVFTPTATLTASTLYSSGFSTPVSAGTAVTSAATAEYRFVETIQNGTNSGTITVQDAPQGTGNLTNLAGTECELTPQTQVP